MIDKHIYEIKLYVLHRAESTYMKFIRYNCKYSHVCKKTCLKRSYLFTVPFSRCLSSFSSFVQILCRISQWVPWVWFPIPAVVPPTDGGLLASVHYGIRPTVGPPPFGIQPPGDAVLLSISSAFCTKKDDKNQ